jgi:ABC-type transport system substrate-binding protein
LRGTTWQAIAKELYGDPKQGPDLFTLYSTSLFWDPYGWLFKFYHSRNIIGGYNLGYNNPKVDSLLEKASQTIDRKERDEVYKELRQVLIDDTPSAWVCMIPYVAIYRKNIKVYPYTRIGDRLGNIVYTYDMYKE